jgi:bifunctional UDP-N-acetylglucosamine pyrophosphorylase/glucosamine-1-phosphate N-acetyltransferase
MPTALVILAAGLGSRMNSDTPKTLHPIGGAPMVAHALWAGAVLEPSRIIVVTGQGADAVEAAVADAMPEAICVHQDQQLGTGHAVRQAQDALAGFEGDVIVLYADTPFITAETLQQMQAARANNDVVVLGFEAADPGRYGRLVMSGDQLDRIVEAKDANDHTVQLWPALRRCRSIDGFAG